MRMRIVIVVVCLIRFIVKDIGEMKGKKNTGSMRTDGESSDEWMALNDAISQQINGP